MRCAQNTDVMLTLPIGTNIHTYNIQRKLTDIYFHCHTKCNQCLFKKNSPKVQQAMLAAEFMAAYPFRRVFLY
jgi:hypothetical protein